MKKKNWFCFLIGFLILVSATQVRAQFDELNVNPLETSRKIELRPSCYSDDVQVTRYFYIPNNGDEPLFLEKEAYDYVFGVGEEYNPKMVSAQDNYGNNLPAGFGSQGGLKIFYSPIPKQDITISPGDFYLLTTVYVARANASVKENENYRLEFKSGTTGDYNLEEMRVILPGCFLFKREFIDSYPEPSNEQDIGGDIVLTYKDPQRQMSVDVLGINSTSIYKPGVLYRYTLDVGRAVIWTVLTILAIILGVWITPKIKRWFSKDSK